MRRQKGQAVVEFALVLPFFFMLFWGIVYTGLLYSDYLTLSNFARESARVASIEGKAACYETMRSDVSPPQLSTRLYLWDVNSDSDFHINDANDSFMTVTLTANLNTSFPGVGIMSYLGMSLPEEYKIVYSMYKEYQTPSSEL